MMNFIKTVQINIFCRRFPLCRVISRSQSDASADTAQSHEDNDPAPSGDKTVIDEETVERLRDVSRLSIHLRNRMEHALTVDQRRLARPRKNAFVKQIINKMEFAKFGHVSNISPAVCWPSKEDLHELIEDEKGWEPSLQQMWDENRAEREASEADRQAKAASVEAQMNKMPEYFESYKKRLRKQADMEKEQAEKRKTQLEEAREYLGFALDPRDPRFKQMMDAKAEEEALEKKKKKKLEKKLKQMEHIEKQAKKPENDTKKSNQSSTESSKSA